MDTLIGEHLLGIAGRFGCQFFDLQLFGTFLLVLFVQMVVLIVVVVVVVVLMVQAVGARWWVHDDGCGHVPVLQRIVRIVVGCLVTHFGLLNFQCFAHAQLEDVLDHRGWMTPKSVAHPSGEQWIESVGAIHWVRVVINETIGVYSINTDCSPPSSLLLKRSFVCSSNL